SGPTPSTMLMLANATYLTNAELKRCARECAAAELRLIVLVERERIAAIDTGLEISDFIATPPDPDELIARARRALREPRRPGPEEEGIIRVGDLVIDTSSYEVTVKGSRIGLRFKEYELLRLMAENQGRVFSREILLNQVWGYEYFGGTRTVDVHVRRLRSKIEDADHHFIETIWNVGYRFRQTCPPPLA
ncbi:response regulator transcription factor, partial [Dehalococcoidia bacterium]|nr:response regulator transcription factor [Dehalococcoidia bacterium]